MTLTPWCTLIRMAIVCIANLKHTSTQTKENQEYFTIVFMGLRLESSSTQRYIYIYMKAHISLSLAHICKVLIYLMREALSDKG